MQAFDALTRTLLRAAMAMALSTASLPASAHDTWFERLPWARPAELVLALGTGNRFPVHEFTVAPASLVQRGCLANASGAKAVPLTALRETTKSLILRARPMTPGPVTCWAQQTPFDVEIEPRTVEVYFREINPPPAVRAAWAEMQARGVGWKERFTKHARIEVRGSTANALPARPTEMGMDALLESGLQAIHPGDTLAFQVLRDGQPLPDQAMELRSDVSPIGFWRTTDAQGRVSFQAPVAGNWVLRGTDLRLSTTLPDTWDSRFVTLAFEVVPADPTHAR